MFLDYLRTSHAYVVPPILGCVVLLGLAGLSLLRGRKDPAGVLFAAICFLGAVINADVAAVSLIADKALALKVDRASYLVTVFSLPVYIQFVHSFLGIRSRRWLEILAYLTSVGFLFFTQTEHFIRGFFHYSFGTIAQAGPAYQAFSVCVGCTVCYCLTVLYLGVRRARDNLQRNRTQYILGGLGMSGLLLALNILPVSGVAFYPMGNFSFVPAIFLAYGVLKYDLLDIGAVIRRGVLYFALTGALTVMYVLVLYLFHAPFVTPGSGHTILLPLILALVVVFLFHPLRNRVQRFIDRLFFRDRYDYRRFLAEVSGDLASLMNVDQIRRLLFSSLSGALGVEDLSLAVLRHGQEVCRIATTRDGGTHHREKDLSIRHAVFPLLATRKTPLGRTAAESLSLPPGEREAVLSLFDDLCAGFLFPLLARGDLVGFLAIGQKMSGELLVAEDMALLETLAHQSAVSLENARIYGELQELNRDLERKVQERTAALRGALAEKERTQQQLIQSESLAAIGQLVAGTAHELNNPLAGASSLIQTSADALEEWDVKTGDKGEVLADLRFSLKEVRRAGDIVRSLLDLSRQTQTYVESVQMNTVLDDALRILQNRFKGLPVRIEKRYAPNLPAIEGNFANLGQVFINILRNALQSLPESGGAVVLETRRQGDRVVVECTDTGRGISGRYLKDVFKPFFTTKAVGEGTGLGLYISHEIVKRHGGEIALRSAEGRGTTVTVTLPCRRESG